MEVEFDFREEKSGIFGSIYRPIAKIVLINKKIQIPEIFYVDSGADVTLIPYSVGELLLLNNPSSSETINIKGIGKKGVPIVIREIRMMFNDLTIKARVGWCLLEDVPMLLGREDVFKYFNIIFSKNMRSIFKANF